MLYFKKADLGWIQTAPPTGGQFVSYPADKVHDLVFALVLRNATPSTLGCFKLAYVGEQLLINSLGPHESGVKFSFGVSSNFVDLPKRPSTVFPQTDDPDDFYKGYTQLPGLSFGAWRFDATHRNLDGNLPENRRVLSSGYQPLVWHAGEYLVLRWFADASPESIPDKLAVVDPEFIAARFAFSQVERLADGRARLSLCGLSGDAYLVEASEDLRTWRRVGAVTNALGFVDIEDRNAPSGHVFYRAVKD